MFRAMPEAPLPREIVLADSATKLGADAKGAVIVTGSHGARYAAYLTLKAHPRAVIHNDAGVGKESAGIAVIALAEALGVAAATASHATCRIGDAANMLARGRISHVNAVARSLGLREGMPVREAALLLVAARPTGRDPDPIAEARRTLKQPDWQRGIVLMDSASLVRREDEGQIVVTASHGALVGGKAQMALQVSAFAAVFNDAGVGIDRTGISRLPALDAAGIAGVTVSAQSARIGDAQSAYDDGVITHVNDMARRLGASPGEPLEPRLLLWARLPPDRR
jgi:hypothetical protein